ncbi:MULTISPECIES: TonB-dependent receptor [unclassified Methylophaga]|jgi:Fe(3+) dicitrate transport protein|uniref:TonB-dependent receptor family protein n=1 Tax=unclassified Methylophaga TaxID=2629249 RepID=UPI000C950E55|nr:MULTISPECIES: TonB-dependent receptor [unclassified Methylophaga]MAK68110.1 TonB-dependent receptor [Methylophaga sp.]MAY17869.1 TonB-dependent receptor [Methylophaga sp.]HCD03958.1 TonB-dependent receptor [Methylophaga sp.]|tara:strand:+ start:22024 stop:24198 length:2175 start_codon:yes stop_codon:yes gene_type:complete
MNLKPKLISSAIMSSLMLMPYAVLAEEDAIDTGKMTVTGILPDRLESVPGSFDIIDEEYLEERRPISNIERMRSVPGVHVVADGSMGFDTNIGIRGQNPRRSAKTMIMEDGMPLQLAPYLDPVVHYTPASSAVSRIEVVKGAGQILYGPQTLGGAVNFITKPVPRNGEIEGSVSTVFGNQDYRLLHGNVGFGNEIGGVMFDFTQNKGDGIFKGGEFDVKDYRFKGELNITDRQTLGLKLVHTRDRRNQTENYLTIDEYDRDPFSHPTVDLDDWEQDRDVVQLSHIFEVNDNLTLRSQAYYTDTFRNGLRASNTGRIDGDGFSSSRLRSCPAAGGGTILASEVGDVSICGGRHAPRQYYTWGAETRADFGHSLFGLENDAIVGIRYHEEKAHRQQVFATNPAQREDYKLALIEGEDREGSRLDAQAISYFAQNTTYIGNWSLTPGFRVEDVRTTDKDEFTGEKENDNFTEFLPSFGVAWNGIANTTIFAGVHEGISPARADREFTADGGRAEPEESTLYELGFRSAYFNGVVVSATLFHNDIENTVVDNGATFDNSGESEQQGIELAGRINFGDIYGTTNNFYISGAYTNLWTAEYKKAENPDNDGNRMQYAPEHLLNLDFGYEHVSGINARMGVQHVSKQYVDDENTRDELRDGENPERRTGVAGIIPSQTIWNASIDYRVPNSGVTLFAGVENLFDKEYLASRNEGKLPGRERLFFGGITYDF